MSERMENAAEDYRRGDISADEAVEQVQLAHHEERALTRNERGELLDPDGTHSVYCTCEQCAEEEGTS